MGELIELLQRAKKALDYDLTDLPSNEDRVANRRIWTANMSAALALEHALEHAVEVADEEGVTV